MNQAFYESYRRQNPIKYAQKFGDKTPAELAGLVVTPDPVDPVEDAVVAEISTPQDVEVQISEEKPKRARK